MERVVSFMKNNVIYTPEQYHISTSVTIVTLRDTSTSLMAKAEPKSENEQDLKIYAT